MVGDDPWSMTRSWSFAASTASIATARNTAADFVASGPFGAHCDDVRLMVSELVTNAIIHASSTCEITVRWSVERLRVEVSDRSEASPQLQPQTLTEANGRGLFIVESLAAAWGVDHLEAGKVVWFELLSVVEPS